jgi:hypothetical protein
MSGSCSATTTQSEHFPAEKQSRSSRNSDGIRLKFGSYGIEVLESGTRIRVSNLYSIHDGVKINRTFAVVVYPTIIQPSFSKEHEAIIKGQSIGIVFKKNGWVMDKRHQYFGEIAATPDFSSFSRVFHDIGTAQPAIHIYSFFVNKNGSKFHYASIAEVHHPEYLRLQDLSAIYGSEFDSHQVKSKNVSDFLEIIRTKMQGIKLKNNQ